MLKSIGFIKFIVLFILFSILLSTCQMPVRPMTDNLKKDLIFGHLNYDQYDYQTVIDSINKDKTDSKISIQELEIKDDNSIKSFTTQADIILLKGINPATFQGYLNLEPLIQSDQTFSNNDFLPNSLNACADENGNQYGIPIWVYLTGIYYNPQLFTKQQIDYPEYDWTIDSFRLIVSQLEDKYPMVDDGALLSPYIYAHLNKNDGKVNVNQFLEELNWYEDLVKSGNIVLNTEGSGNPFDRSGNSSLWVAFSDEELFPSIKDRVFLPFPVGKDNQIAAGIFSDCIAISANTSNPQLAWDVLKLILNKLPSKEGAFFAKEDISTLSENILYAFNHGGVMSKYSSESFFLRQGYINALVNNMDLNLAIRNVITTYSSKENQMDGTEEELSAVSTPIPTQNPNSITINFGFKYYSQLNYQDHLNSLISEFQNENPGIIVLWSTEIFPKDDNNILGASNEYDCFHYSSPLIDDLPVENLLELDPLIANEGDNFLSSYPDYLFSPFSDGGNIYGLPASNSAEFISINLDLMREKGISIPTSDWSFKDLLLKASEGNDDFEMNSSYGFSAGSSTLLNYLDLEWYEKSSALPRAYLNSPEIISAMDWINNLYLSKSFLPQYFSLSPEKPINYINYQEAIQNGQVLMWVSSYGFESETDYPFSVSYLLFPKDNEGKRLNQTIYPFGYYISRNTVNADACWEWIKFLSNHSYGLLPGLPASTSKESLDVWRNQYSLDHFEIIQSAIHSYRPPQNPFFVEYQPIIVRPYSDWLSAALIRTFQGEDPNLVLNEYQSYADRYHTCISNRNVSGLSKSQLFNQVVEPCAQEIDCCTSSTRGSQPFGCCDNK